MEEESKPSRELQPENGETEDFSDQRITIPPIKPRHEVEIYQWFSNNKITWIKVEYGRLSLLFPTGTKKRTMHIRGTLHRFTVILPGGEEVSFVEVPGDTTVFNPGFNPEDFE